MKKVIRFILSVTMLAFLGISELPAPATCQMIYGNFLATGCQMPCCRTQAPMAQCPMLKAAAPRDFISVSIPIFECALTPLPTSLQLTLPALQPLFHAAVQLTHLIQRTLAGPSLSVRAPPTDIHLLDA